MPIIRLAGVPYYIQISELVKMPILEKFVMYYDKEKRNTPLNTKDIKILKDFVTKKFYDKKVNLQYIDLAGREAVCAVTEMILYHSYFYCKNTFITGTYSSIDVTSKKVSLNDLVYPYLTWNLEVIYQDLIITSGSFVYKINYGCIERILGYFNEFKVILNKAVIYFIGGRIYYEERNEFTNLSIDYAKQFYERKPFMRLFNRLDKRNYKDFVFYLNDNRIYSNPNSRLYYDFETYKKANPDIFDNEQ